LETLGALDNAIVTLGPFKKNNTGTTVIQSNLKYKFDIGVSPPQSANEKTACFATVKSE